MRVAVIGAGAAGLVSARHVTAQGFDCEVFEMASEVGGTWVYTDDVDKDKYGYPIHTAMYKGLRINLPKEVMGFPDFPIPEKTDSYLPAEDILYFLNLYTDHFDLRSRIKFNKMVTDLRPLEDKWQIKSIDKPSGQTATNIYDVVMVCNGHYNTPIIPQISGAQKFAGSVIHSHQYRSIEPYRDQRVLVIGAGFSGLDVALQIASVAKLVIISHHVMKKELKLDSLSNVLNKPEVLRFNNGEEVEFVDGSLCCCDAVIYCTGYKYNFPFLHESCGITFEDHHVQSLYKQVIHIERPTLCFIGIPFYVCAFQMFDIQARFYCQYLNGFMSLPSKEIMRKDTEENLKKRREKGYSKKQTHMLGYYQQEYFDDLAASAKITPIPPVICKIWDESTDRFFDNFLNFRNDRYRIVNNESFVKVK